MAQGYHYPSRDELVRTAGAPVSRTLKLALIALAAIGTLAFLIGLFVDPDRAWRSLHFNWLFFSSVSSAAVTMVAVQRIVTARWSRPVLRFLEGYAAWLPISWVMLLLIVTVGRSHVFTFAHETPPVAEKQFWFSPDFFSIRTLVLYTILVALQLWYIHTSLRLDVGHLPEAGAKWGRGLRDRMRRGFRDERRELHSTHSRQGWLAVVTTIVFAYVWSILAFDLSMGMSLHFQSALYGWWFFMGAWVAMLMSWNLITRWWDRSQGLGQLVSETTYHDLGKLCFAFSAFWGYLTFGQYIIIWYGNLPEETHWFRLRLMDPYQWITVAVFVMMFIVPFFGLMGKKPKLWTPWMTFCALSSILGLWLLRYIETYPSAYGEVAALPFGIWEIGAALACLGLWGSAYVAFMDAFPRLRVTMMSSPFRDEVQIPVDPKTMEPLPAHE